MKRTYLEEDIELIQKYFPGAKAVTVRTPFDLSHDGRRQPRTTVQLRDADDLRGGWQWRALWTN